MEMLTLTIGGSFKIGDLATVKIKDITTGQVRFGIDAPRSVAVHRQEIYQKIKTEGLKTKQTEKPLSLKAKDQD